MEGDKTLDVIQDIQEGHSISSSSIKRGRSVNSMYMLLSVLSPDFRNALLVFKEEQWIFNKILEKEDIMEGDKTLDMLQDIQCGHSLKSSSSKRKVSIENMRCRLDSLSDTMRNAVRVFQEAQKVFQASIEMEIKR